MSLAVQVTSPYRLAATYRGGDPLISLQKIRGQSVVAVVDP